MRQTIVTKKLLQSATEVYYKVCQVLQSVTDCYYKVQQSASGIKKYNSYYKVRCNSHTIPTK